MADEKKEDSSKVSATAYDDAFRIMEEKCDEILLPFINYFFDEYYDENAVVTRLRNERFAVLEKRITDAYFSIEQDGIKKTYHIECESGKYDGSILIRMFQYISMIAVDESTQDHFKVRSRYPNTGLLVLREKGDPPKKAIFEIELPNGKMVSFDAPIMRESDFTVDMMFEKKLYLMLPFFMFNMEKDFDEIYQTPDRIRELNSYVYEVINRVKNEPQSRLSQRSKGVIIRLIKNVTAKLTMKYEKKAEGNGMEVLERQNEFQDVLDWLEEYDRKMAIGTLKLAARLGFKIVKTNPEDGYVCPDCGKRIELEMSYCPHCGRELELDDFVK